MSLQSCQGSKFFSSLSRMKVFTSYLTYFFLASMATTHRSRRRHTHHSLVSTFSSFAVSTPRRPITIIRDHLPHQALSVYLFFLPSKPTTHCCPVASTAAHTHCHPPRRLPPRHLSHQSGGLDAIMIMKHPQFSNASISFCFWDSQEE